jgi:hypothetical protein
MRAMNSILVAVLCFTLVESVTALPQSSARELNAQPVAYDHSDFLAGRNPGDKPATRAERATLESSIHREGLQFYFEIRSGGLQELAQAANALGPVTKLLASGPMKVSTPDMASFLVGHFGLLAGARLALVGYGANGMAALIEAGSDSDAEQIRAGIAQLLGAGKVARKAGEMGVKARGRLVVAGSPAITSAIIDASGGAVIANDQGFMKARARFPDDPFFAYMDLASMPLAAMPGGGDNASAAYTAGALAALNSKPYAIAVGGSLEGDSVMLRALLLFNTDQSAGPLAGLFSSVASQAGMGRPVGASFAATDADLFVDVMIDWEKLYEAIGSVFSAIAGAQSNEASQSGVAQSPDLFAMAEASLGFSIKNDLLPTLGNEVAISLSGFDRFFGPASRPVSNAGKAAPLPRFMLMVALKDPAKFEKLIGRIISTPGRASAQLARVPYRGATVTYNKDVAYAISGGFFIIGGSRNDICRALDARALGNSLASTPEFRASVGSSGQAMMQAYLSPGVAHKIYELIYAEVVKSNAELKDYVGKTAQPRSAIGLTMASDPDGLSMEMRVPTNLAFMAIAAMASGKPASYPITSAPSSGIGIPNPTTPASRTRNADGRRVPKMTSDDLMNRRP